MTSSTSPTDRKSALNVPNAVTSVRLLLSIILFVFLAYEFYRVSLVLFIIAAGTDWVDGYWARKYGQVTVLGRILDPFADKIIVCGTFVFLAAVDTSFVRAWFAVVIIGRELLVTALRSFLEEQGADFSAKMAGKLKMVIQCLAIGFCLTHLSVESLGGTSPNWLTAGSKTLLWVAVGITIYSGVEYILVAIRILKNK